MIKLWINPKVTLYYPLHDRDIKMPDGSVKLDELPSTTWFDRLIWEPSDVKIGMDLLTQGYEFSQADMMELKHEGKIKL